MLDWKIKKVIFLLDVGSFSLLTPEIMTMMHLTPHIRISQAAHLNVKKVDPVDTVYL